MPVREGGSYEVQKGGKVKQIEPPTQPHSGAPGPHDAKGKPLDAAPEPDAATPTANGNAAASATPGK